ncbi:MAG: B12-binding domain-containing radical SAM protein, partial [Chitinophagaceae bacterium]
FLRLDPKQWKTGLPYAPLGTLYAASLLRNHGYRVSLFDTMFSEGPDELLKHIAANHPDIFVLYDDGFNFLTKMCLSNMRQAALKMIALARKKHCTIIVSSSDATDFSEQFLDAGADFVINGEGEMTLLALVKALSAKEGDYSQIEGITFSDNGKIKRTVRRNLITDLDNLHFPAWDLIDINPYRNSWLRNAGYFSINMATTRGCPYKCNWCAKPLYGNRYHTKSPENVVKEIKWLHEKFHFNHIWFCDDIFGLKPGWSTQFADLAEKEHLPVKYKIQCRPDLLVKEDFVNDLARSGCENVWMGAESGSQKILDAMDKGTRVEQIYQSARLLKKHGINPSFFIQFGYPGEAIEDIKMTIRMINDLLPYQIGISVSYPLPGTKFYDRVKTELKGKSHWTDSDEMMLMFRNTYSPAFYKQLHRYVHKNYHKHLAMECFKHLFKKSSLSLTEKIRKSVSIAYYFPATFFSKRKLNNILRIFPA